MRVLFLTKYHVRRDATIEVFGALSHHLRAFGVEVTVYSSDASAAEGPLPGGTQCVHGPLPKPAFFSLPFAALRIASWCRNNGVDLIHAHGLYRGGWAAREVTKRTGLPYVVTSHGDIAMTSSRMHRPDVRRRCGLILKDASAVTHLSAAMAEMANQFADVRAKSCIITNGLDLTVWGTPNPSPAEGYVLAIGRLVAQKGFGTLLEAVARLKRQGCGPSVVIAGQGPEQEALEKQAGELGLSVCRRPEELPRDGGAVCFPGYVSGDLKQKVYAGSRVVAFPSRGAEAFGLVLVEAMAAGRAVVASDLPAVRETVTEGRNGLIVPAEDPAAWADAIQKLLSDDALRGQMARTNREDVARYNWRSIAGQYADLYRRVLAESKGGGARLPNH
ncbi:MAG: glycosyltransferase family 4 protein [Verrucomicrobia bacterium]|nr:glycosyltransferase family 4 protein [Verrucomicrobiota bacterium]